MKNHLPLAVSGDGMPSNFNYSQFLSIPQYPFQQSAVNQPTLQPVQFIQQPNYPFQFAQAQFPYQQQVPILSSPPQQQQFSPQQYQQMQAVQQQLNSIPQMQNYSNVQQFLSAQPSHHLLLQSQQQQIINQDFNLQKEANFSRNANQEKMKFATTSSSNLVQILNNQNKENLQSPIKTNQYKNRKGNNALVSSSQENFKDCKMIITSSKATPNKQQSSSSNIYDRLHREHYQLQQKKKQLEENFYNKFKSQKKKSKKRGHIRKSTLLIEQENKVFKDKIMDKTPLNQLTSPVSLTSFSPQNSNIISQEKELAMRAQYQPQQLYQQQPFQMIVQSPPPFQNNNQEQTQDSQTLFDFYMRQANNQYTNQQNKQKDSLDIIQQQTVDNSEKRIQAQESIGGLNQSKSPSMSMIQQEGAPIQKVPANAVKYETLFSKVQKASAQSVQQKQIEQQQQDKKKEMQQQKEQKIIKKQMMFSQLIQHNKENNENCSRSSTQGTNSLSTHSQKQQQQQLQQLNHIQPKSNLQFSPSTPLQTTPINVIQSQNFINQDCKNSMNVQKIPQGSHLSGDSYYSTQSQPKNEEGNLEDQQQQQLQYIEPYEEQTYHHNYQINSVRSSQHIKTPSKSSTSQNNENLVNRISAILNRLNSSKNLGKEQPSINPNSVYDTAEHVNNNSNSIILNNNCIKIQENRLSNQFQQSQKEYNFADNNERKTSFNQNNNISNEFSHNEMQVLRQNKEDIKTNSKYQEQLKQNSTPFTFQQHIQQSSNLSQTRIQPAQHFQSNNSSGIINNSLGGSSSNRGNGSYYLQSLKKKEKRQESLQQKGQRQVESMSESKQRNIGSNQKNEDCEEENQQTYRVQFHYEEKEQFQQQQLSRQQFQDLQNFQSFGAQKTQSLSPREDKKVFLNTQVKQQQQLRVQESFNDTEKLEWTIEQDQQPLKSNNNSGSHQYQNKKGYIPLSVRLNQAKLSMKQQQ